MDITGKLVRLLIGFGIGPRGVETEEDYRGLFKRWGWRRVLRSGYMLLNSVGSHRFEKRIFPTPLSQKKERTLREVVDYLGLALEGLGCRVSMSDSDLSRIRIVPWIIPSFELEFKSQHVPTLLSSNDFGIGVRGRVESSPELEGILNTVVKTLDEVGPVLRQRDATYPEVLISKGSYSLHCISKQRIELRPTLACNHKCDFCNSPSGALPSNSISRKEFQEVLSSLEPLRLSQITISGGEPTLLKKLPDFLTMCTELGYFTELQTNGMALSDISYAKVVRESGLTTALISLHSQSSSTSDQKITYFPGGWEKTVQGIDNALNLGIRVAISHVIYGVNQHQTQDFFRFVNKRWGRKVVTRLAFVAPTGAMRSRMEELMPDLRELSTGLERTFTYVKQNRLRVKVVGYCGIPPCLLGSHANLSDITKYRFNFDGSKDHIKLEPCNGCAYESRCPGLWREYYDMMGDPGLVRLSRSIF